MIAIKLNVKLPPEVLPYLKEHNKLKRCLFNLMKKRGISHVEAVKVVEKEYAYDKTLADNFILRDCIGIQATGMLESHLALGRKTLIFGSRKAWKEVHTEKQTKEDFRKSRDEPSVLYTGRANTKGNSKFSIDAENSRLIFKPSRGVKIPIPFKTSNTRLKQLGKLQALAELKQTAFSVQMSGDSVSILCDESTIEDHKRKFIRGRIAALDAGPNVFGWAVSDFKGTSESVKVFKECVSVYDLKKSGNTGKIKQELSIQAKRIALHARHLQVELFGLEKLSMTGDAGKGKAFNRTINNDWKREHFRKSLVKWLSIYRIPVQEVLPQFSSTVGCLQNPDETDSVAASFELARRAYVFQQKYVIKNPDFAGESTIFPPFSKEALAERWNSKLSFPKGKLGWESLHRHLKNMKPNPLRLLFRDYDFRSWFCFRPQLGHALVAVHSFRMGVACS